MILNDKAVTIIRTAMAECEKAIGTEYADVYTAKLLGRLETVLELAEAVPEVSVGSPIVMKTPETTNLHQQIIKMRVDGKMVGEIAKKLDVSIQTVCDHLDFQRKQEAK